MQAIIFSKRKHVKVRTYVPFSSFFFFSPLVLCGFPLLAFGAIINIPIHNPISLRIRIVYIQTVLKLKRTKVNLTKDKELIFKEILHGVMEASEIGEHVLNGRILKKK